MPSGGAAKQKTDAVIKTVCLGVDGDAKREMPCRKIGKPAQKRGQIGPQNTAPLGGNDAFRRAFEKSGGNAIGKPLQMEPGAASAAARRNMGRLKPVDCHSG